MSFSGKRSGLLLEVNHRAKNSIAMAITMLRLQIGRHPNPETAAALEEAILAARSPGAYSRDPLPAWLGRRTSYRDGGVLGRAVPELRPPPERERAARRRDPGCRSPDPRCGPGHQRGSDRR